MSNKAEEEEEEEEYVPFVTPAQRRKNEQLKKLRKGGLVVAPQAACPSQTAPTALSSTTTTTTSTGAIQPPPLPAVKETEESLFSIAKRMRRENELDPLAAQKRMEEEQEQRILESALAASTQSLISAKERAQDANVAQRAPVDRSWWHPKSPKQGEGEEDLSQYAKLIVVDGEDVPAMQTSFEDLNLPPQLVHWLARKKHISRPSPIQMQGLPVCLSGRDMIGVASTGSGKTLCFAIPAVLISWHEAQQCSSSSTLPAAAGPFAIIIGPSRELMRQTFQIVSEACAVLAPSQLQVTLCIGGESKSQQLEAHRKRGSQLCVGTPGRLLDFLNSRDISLAACTLLVLDEGDRMLDEGFDEEVKRIMGHFTPNRPRQTVLFSATMPRRVLEFARDALHRPVIVNVGRAGAASANIVQHIEPMQRREDRFVMLLQALQRTEPPVLIFTSKNNDVDDAHLYLMLKGLLVRGIHAKKSQQERNQAVDDFKNGLADILVASDVGAKGLDFANIQHVINLDLPSEIENYVHRIGRTGRGVGTTGVSTTFIDLKTLNECATIHADLAGILRDARQRVPKFLTGGDVGKYEDPLPPPGSALDEANATTTCTVCGGFGHRVINCPKLSTLGRKGQTRDVVTGGDY